MFRARFLSLFLLLLTASFVYAQTPGNFVSGQTLPAAQLNSALAGKQDFPSPAATNTTMVVATPAALSAATIPTPIQIIYVTSMSGTQPVTAGQSNCGLLFSRGTSTPAGLYGEILNGGIYWEPVYSTSPVKTCEFGALGDNTTDATAAIQAAVDYAIRYGFAAVCLADGKYKTTDTIHMGYGGNNSALSSVSLVTCNEAERGSYLSASMQGGAVWILPTKTDRCAVNFQGARLSAIRGIRFLGANFQWTDWVLSRGGSGGPPNSPVIGAAYPSADSAWLDVGLVPGGNNPVTGFSNPGPSGGLTRYTPYAAICVDAYSDNLGVQTTYYPNVTYPSWTGIVNQYSVSPPANAKNNSSDIEFINLTIEGFAVGIVVQPGNTDGNGDFMKFDKILCTHSTYCISISQSQSRNVQFTNISSSGVHTLLSNNTFGEQNGTLILQCDNIHVGNAYQYFNIRMLNQGYFACKDLYSEELVRIGSFTGFGAFSGDIQLENCQINFYDWLHGSSPAAFLDITGSTVLTMKNCSLNGWSRMQTLVNSGANAPYIINDGGSWQGFQRVDASGLNDTTGGVQAASTFAGSLFMGNSAVQETLNSTPNHFVDWKNQIPSGSLTAPTVGGGAVLLRKYPQFVNNARRIQYTQAIGGLIDIYGATLDFGLRPQGTSNDLHNINGQITTGAAISGCDTMTFGYSIGAQAVGNDNFNTAVGDIWFHQNTGTLYVVTAIAGGGPYTITTRQMNNMTLDANGACVTNNIANGAALTGATFLVHANVFMPMVTLFGDFAAGSTRVTNISGLGNVNGSPNQSSFGEGIAALFSVGDILRTYQYTGNSNDSGTNWPIATGTKVATVTNGSGSNPNQMTLSNTASVTGRFPLQPLPVVGYGVPKTDLGIFTTGSALGSAPAQFLLPACQSGISGVTATILDSSTATPGATINAAGTGANKVKAVCNASNNWVVLFAL
jgi:hypothetical protein